MKNKFRGKILNGDEWINGFYFQRCGAHFILTNTFYVNGTLETFEDINGNPIRQEEFEIDLKTLSQYIGKEDSEKIEIYDGDILKNEFDTHLVFWNDEESAFNLKDIREGRIYGISSFIDTLKIIGNKNQNPELLVKK